MSSLASWMGSSSSTRDSESRGEAVLLFSELSVLAAASWTFDLTWIDAALQG